MAQPTHAPERPLAVVIAGGGTGGHLYPGLAVARQLVRRVPDAQVTFAGTARGLEARVVPREGYGLDVIRSAGLKGKSFAARLRGLRLIVPGLADAWRIVSRRRPSVVIGVGGYSSGPVVLVAALRGVPTLVMEQNVVPGLANRWLSRFVRAAAVTFEESLPFFHGRGFVTGNPVREEFFSGPSASGDGRANGQRVLVVGGSQGAHAINVAMVAAAPELARRVAGFELVHQTGERDVDAVKAAYANAGIAARAEAFLDPVVGEMKAANVLVCRAGFTTLAELAAIGRPAVLIPLPSADDHQLKNARAFAEAGAAMVIEQRDLTPAALGDAVAALLVDRARLDRMAGAMRTFARPDAAARIVDRALELAGRTPPTGVPGTRP